MELVRDVVLRLAEFLRMYLDACARIVTAVSEEFSLGLPEAGATFVGSVLGSIVLFGFVRRLSKWDHKGDKPQPFPLKTAETPNEVVAKDVEKFLALLLRVSLFVLLLLVLAMMRE